MLKDQRVTSYSSPTGKLQMRAAMNVEHRAIVDDKQHVVDKVESITHDTLDMCCFRSRRSSKSTPRLRAPLVGLTTIPPTDNDGIVKFLLCWLDLVHRHYVLSQFSLSLLDFIQAQSSSVHTAKVWANALAFPVCNRNKSAYRYVAKVQWSLHLIGFYSSFMRVRDMILLSILQFLELGSSVEPSYLTLWLL